jgi:hypothetical protein
VDPVGQFTLAQFTWSHWRRAVDSASQRRRGVRRLVQLLAWCFVLGVIANIGVALGIAVRYSVGHPRTVDKWGQIGLSQSNYAQPPEFRWAFPPRSEWDGPYESYVTGSRWCCEQYALGSAASDVFGEQATLDVGFPWRCLGLQREREIAASQPRYHLLFAPMNGWRTGTTLTIPGGSGKRVALPLRPNLALLFANSAVYSAGLIALVGMWRGAKRLRRIPPETCRTCGYLVGDLPRCPECGASREPHSSVSRPACLK